jgi:hypothetical protein
LAPYTKPFRAPLRMASMSWYRGSEIKAFRESMFEFWSLDKTKAQPSSQCIIDDPRPGTVTSPPKNRSPWSGDWNSFKNIRQQTWTPWKNHTHK